MGAEQNSFQESAYVPNFKP
jgi:hypothetical protein